MPEKSHMAEGHYLVTSQVGCFLLLSNPRRAPDWLTLGQSEMAGWSHGTDLGAGGCSQRMGRPLRWTVHPRSFCILQASVSSWLPLTTSLMCLLASVSPPLLTVERENFDLSQSVVSIWHQAVPWVEHPLKLQPLGLGCGGRGVPGCPSE